MDRRRRCVRVEQCVQLVVERPGSLHHRDVLRDAWQARAGFRVVETLREPRSEICDLCAEYCHEPPTEERQQHLREVILGRRIGVGCLQSGLLPENRPV